MKFANATKFNRKSGEAEGSAVHEPGGPPKLIGLKGTAFRPSITTTITVGFSH
jgi:hypothetical protein